MSPLEKAIAACGSQAELARRMGGKTKTGHIYYWLTNGVTPAAAPLIERAVDGAVRCEQLCTSVDWIRDKTGKVTSFCTPVEAA